MNAAAARKQADLTVDHVWDSGDEQRRLLAVLSARYTAMLAAMHELVRLTFDLPAEGWRIDDAATRQVLQDAARQVVRIDETTRQAIAQRLQEGQMLGLSDWELANGSARLGYAGIEQLFTETWAGRPLMVARTELAQAQNTAAQNRYQASGLVDRVRITDGTVGGDEPCLSRNGTVVPVSQSVPLLHPNCTASVSPVLREGVA